MLIDPRDVMKRMSLDELNVTADVYFSSIDDPVPLLEKPFGGLQGSVEDIQTFLLVLKGLGLPPGSTLLDFGAGTCWTSILASGFGYRVIAADVSVAALDLGRRLLRERPPLVPHQPPEFLHFDGRRLALPDASIDGILCISAFHHVPNQRDVLSEFSRVLKPGGRAGFNEPGPIHSRSPQAQDEMRRFNVLENDIIIQEIQQIARDVGFPHLELALFYPEAVFTTLSGFDNFMAGHPSQPFDHALRLHMANRRMFFLEKGEDSDRLSITPEGLDATLQVVPLWTGPVPTGDRLQARVHARNTGQTIWRPSRWPLGPVRLGASSQGEAGEPSVDFLRHDLPDRAAPGLRPGEAVDFTADFSAPTTRGTSNLQFQLVAEGVAWFGETSVLQIVAI
jgi:SAM-dependent methyltransferase